MANFDVEVLRSVALKAAAPRYIDVAYQKAQKEFNKSKSEMIEEFENHPVTEEIKLGPSAPNISNTLGGEGAKGNLFSFIGFEEDEEDPTKVVKDILKDETTLEKTSDAAKYGRNSIKYSFPVTIPNMEDIEEVTPLPWENGRSWVTGIEKGISGLGHYIYREFFEASRSSTGLQRKGKISSRSFRSVKYLTAILKKFADKYK